MLRRHSRRYWEIFGIQESFQGMKDYFPVKGNADEKLTLLSRTRVGRIKEVDGANMFQHGSARDLSTARSNVDEEAVGDEKILTEGQPGKVHITVDGKRVSMRKSDNDNI